MQVASVQRDSPWSKRRVRINHVLLALSTHDGRSVRYRQTHLLRAARKGGFGSVDFEILERDPIELAAWRCANVMASQWIARLDAGESIQWNALATLTPTGIASWHGPSKGTIALYSELAPIVYARPSVTLRMHDGTRFLTLDTSDTNVHPGYLVMSVLIGRFSPDSE